LNCKRKPSQEEHKTVFSNLEICKIALSHQINFLAFFHLQKAPYWNCTNSGKRQ
jgi:hypothetical protein